MKDYQDYHRHPIQINTNTIMMIELFHLDKCISHCIDCDCPNKLDADMATHEEGADQFISQLEGHWNEAFLIALRNRINKELDDQRQQREKFHKSQEKK